MEDGTTEEIVVDFNEFLGFSSFLGEPSTPNSSLGPTPRSAAEQVAVIEGKTW
jgi:hypothetical protein